MGKSVVVSLEDVMNTKWALTLNTDNMSNMSICYKLTLYKHWCRDLYTNSNLTFKHQHNAKAFWKEDW